MKTDVEIKYNIKVLENVEEITWEFLGEVASYVNEFVEIQLAASDLLGTSYLKASVLDVATELHEIRNDTKDFEADLSVVLSTRATIVHASQIPSNLIECIVLRDIKSLYTSDIEYFEELLQVQLTFPEIRGPKLAFADIKWLLWGAKKIMTVHEIALFNTSIIGFLNNENDASSSTIVSSKSTQALHVLITTQELHTGSNETHETNYDDNKYLQQKDIYNSTFESETDAHNLLEVQGIVFGSAIATLPPYKELLLEKFHSSRPSVLLEYLTEAWSSTDVFSDIYHIEALLGDSTNISNPLYNEPGNNINFVQQPWSRDDQLHLLEPRIVVIIMVTLHLLIMAGGGMYIFWRKRQGIEPNKPVVEMAV